MILADIAVLLISFYFLALVTNEYFLHSVDYIAKKFKIQSDVAGATLLAAGSSAPELFIAIFAIMFVSGNHESLGVGTIVGSALFNLFIIVGVSSIFNHAKITWQSVTRDLLFYAISIILLILSLWDKSIDLFEAIRFLLIYIIYIYAVINWEKWFKYQHHDKLKPKIVSKGTDRMPLFDLGITMLEMIIPTKRQEKHYWGTFIVSLLLIGGLSYLLVKAAISLSVTLGVPEGIIALTVLAIGTSIPDLLSSFFVSKEGRGDMAISNAVGSNVFNVLVGLGLPWLLVILATNSSIETNIHNGNLLSAMGLLLSSVIMILGVLMFNKWKMGKNVGALLIFVYIVYILYLVAKSSVG
jgi:K+-dependent Na+/Ca+ exchanger-like protein